MDVPLPGASMDAVVSQEALLHVPDKGRHWPKRFASLKPAGGSPSPTGRRMRHCVPPMPICCGAAWRLNRCKALLAIARCWKAPAFVSLRWTISRANGGAILAERLAMYRTLREEAARAGTPPGHDAFTNPTCASLPGAIRRTGRCAVHGGEIMMVKNARPRRRVQDGRVQESAAKTKSRKASASIRIKRVYDPRRG